MSEKKWVVELSAEEREELLGRAAYQPLDRRTSIFPKREQCQLEQQCGNGNKPNPKSKRSVSSGGKMRRR